MLGKRTSSLVYLVPRLPMLEAAVSRSSSRASSSVSPGCRTEAGTKKRGKQVREQQPQGARSVQGEPRKAEWEGGGGQVGENGDEWSEPIDLRAPTHPSRTQGVPTALTRPLMMLA